MALMWCSDSLEDGHYDGYFQIFSTQKYFLKVMTSEVNTTKLLGLELSGKKVDICADEDMKGSSAPVCCGVFCLIIFR